MGELLIGVSSWTDKTLLASGWYPPSVKTAEARLQYYAERFPVVEVDSTYYGMPSERNAALWVERTDPSFTFNVKAFSLMTGHPAQPKSLPKSLRERAPDKRTIYPKDLPRDAIEEIFEMFRRALMPLHSAGKLGCVLFQFPEWFVPSKANKDEVLRCKERLDDYTIAVEFRQRTWMSDDARTERTLSWLAENDVPHVIVDMPQGFASSMPSVAAVTSKQLAVVRFHGRNTETWKKKGLTVAERFNYLYDEAELAEWQPRLFELASQAKRTHAVFNNCYRDNAVRNAAQLAAMIENLE
ncbi:MAG: DUF72 domain-containing protein [Actinobacteria bacterium]|nr:DUF72 domain-containing protein [Actinomycetota bacterium]